MSGQTEPRKGPDDDIWKHLKRRMALVQSMPIYNAPEPSMEMVTQLEIIPYMKLITKIQLLVGLGKFEPKEVSRLVSMLDSTDPENWHVAEECIKQKFSEL